MRQLGYKSPKLIEGCLPGKGRGQAPAAMVQCLQATQAGQTGQPRMTLHEMSHRAYKPPIISVV